MAEDIDTTAEFSVCEDGHIHVHITGTAMIYPSSIASLAEGIQQALDDPQQFPLISIPLVVPLTYVVTREAAMEKVNALRSQLEIAQAITVRKAQQGFEG